MIKFLANENIPAATVRKLQNEGFDVVSVSENFPAINDKAVILFASAENRIIITFDRDYGELIFKQGIKFTAGVIYFRIQSFSPEKPADILLRFLSNADLQFEGFFTVNCNRRKSNATKTLMTAKLNVNIDHVATIREARKTIEPSIITAAVICEQAGAHGITVHLRQDRRHIQDRDIELLREVVTTYLNVEMAATEEMLQIALRTKPDAVSLVPESPNEITTEGGLNVIGNFENVKNVVEKLKAAGIFVSLFIDPDLEQIEAAKGVGAQQVELCTAEYADLTLSGRAAHGEGAERANAEVGRIKQAAARAKELGLIVAAGHGLTYRNIGALAAVEDITEFNIGHNIISRSVFVGLNQAVKEMIEAIS